MKPREKAPRPRPIGRAPTKRPRREDAKHDAVKHESDENKREVQVLHEENDGWNIVITEEAIQL